MENFCVSWQWATMNIYVGTIKRTSGDNSTLLFHLETALLGMAGVTKWNV